jgi:transcriptional regulator with XRE-family HTH domain
MNTGSGFSTSHREEEDTDMESTKRTVGDNIVELREFHGLSRWQLAKAAKLGYGTLKQWETGGRSPHAVLLRRVARALMVPIDRLLQGVSESE